MRRHAFLFAALVWSACGTPTDGSNINSLAPVVDEIDPHRAPIGSEVRISGKNFAADPGANMVLFGGVAADVPSPESSTTALFVVVPEGIANPPRGKLSGELSVEVITPTGSVTTRTTLTAELLQKLPRIQSITPSVAVIGKEITIEGKYLTGTTNEVKVLIDGVAVEPTRRAQNRLVVTVPSLPSLQPGDERVVLVKVEAEGARSPAYATQIKR